MIFVDANLLLYAYNGSAEEHPRSKEWLEEVLSGAEPVALCWPVLLAFIRIATNPRAFPRPLSRLEAMSEGKISGPLVSDAHLATITIEHGGTLYTTDRDFSRFPNLRFVNPIEA